MIWFLACMAPTEPTAPVTLTVDTGPLAETDCFDGRDEDDDGLADCEDPDCEAACTEDLCDDGLDQDQDGQIDCLDEDCWGRTDCMTGVRLELQGGGFRFHGAFTNQNSTTWQGATPDPNWWAAFGWDETSWSSFDLDIHQQSYLFSSFRLNGRAVWGSLGGGGSCSFTLYGSRFEACTWSASDHRLRRAAPTETGWWDRAVSDTVTCQSSIGRDVQGCGDELGHLIGGQVRGDRVWASPRINQVFAQSTSSRLPQSSSTATYGAVLEPWSTPEGFALTFGQARSAYGSPYWTRDRTRWWSRASSNSQASLDSQAFSFSFQP